MSDSKKTKLRFTLSKFQDQHIPMSKRRIAGVYVIKSIEIMIAIASMAIILLHTRQYIFSLGMILALISIVTNISVLSMAIAVDFSRYLDVANMIMLFVLYVLTCAIWTYWYLFRDDRLFVLVLAGLDFIVIIFLVIDFFVHYTMLDQGLAEKREQDNEEVDSKGK